MKKEPNWYMLPGHTLPKLKEVFEYADKISGGKGDDMTPDDVDSDQLKMGIKIEQEHTNDAEIAREIAIDHLAEDPQYYSKLKKAGL